MIGGLFGAGTSTWQLRGGLEELSATHRTIATRLADASRASTDTAFEAELADATRTRLSEEELLTQMTALADTQLRYEAAVRLLQKAYADVRIATRHG